MNYLSILLFLFVCLHLFTCTLYHLLLFAFACGTVSVIGHLVAD
jgi:hypothetical protein